MNNYNQNDGTAKKRFWKRNSSKVPGSSISPKGVMHELSQNTSRHKLTFKEFEDRTEDAWDAGDDDLLRTALAKVDIGVGSDQVHATAQAVIDHHSQARSTPQKLHAESAATTARSSATSAIPLSTAIKALPATSSSGPTSSSKKFPGGATRTVDKVSAEDSYELSRDKELKEKTHSATANKDEHDKITTNLAQEANPDSKLKPLTTRITLLPTDPEKAGSVPRAQTIRMPTQATDRHKEKSRIKKFEQLINSESTDLGDLRELSWPGIPSPVRAVTWQLLSGYLPASKDRRESTLTRKRNEYFKFVEQFYEDRDQQFQSTFHQIHIDIPRTNPLVPLFQQPIVQNIFERLLFVWAIRHPASGYVQGINDLVTPFFVVFLTAQIGEECDVETYEVSALSEPILKAMEADTFWCLSNLLDGIQDNYTFAQPGVQTKVNKLKELTKRVDAELHAHLEACQIEYLQFSFRWMNNLLMREIPLRCTIRLWDTYLAETDGFSEFHLYVCAAFLKHWRKKLLSKKDFQEIMLAIQNVPTNGWAGEEIKLLLAEAFRLKYTFAGAPSHLPNKR